MTRASDSWFELGQGRVAVVLERCPASDAAAFGDRLTIAAHSRPVIASGEKIAFELKVAVTEWNAHQFLTVEEFLGAALAARPRAAEPRRRFVTDGRELRERLYGREDNHIRAA